VTWLFADVAVVAACALVLWRLKSLRFAHPATSYFIFHLIVVTARACSVAAGGSLLFEGTSLIPIDLNELRWAIVLSDIALVSVTAGAVISRLRRISAPKSKRLNPELIWLTTVLLAPLSLIATFQSAVLPWANTAVLTFDSWTLIGQCALGLCLLVLVYAYGFRPLLLVPLFVLLALMAYQGFHRFRVVIPAIMLCTIWLDRNRRRWPSFALSCLLVLVALTFIPLKTVGRLAQDHQSLSEIVEQSKSQILSSFDGYGELVLLDQMAAAVSAADSRGLRFWGKPYAAILTLPIPRKWWPEKPGLADHLAELSSPGRPLAESGMITTLAGDVYVNFGILGVILLPGLLTFFLSRACDYAYAVPYDTVRRFLYVAISANYIQVWRDGMTSLVVFTVVNMAPLLMIICLHSIIPGFRLGRRSH